MRAIILIIALASPAASQQISEPAQPTLIDATKLSVAELLALAAQERAEQSAQGCCDWGGLGCVPHQVRAGS